MYNDEDEPGAAQAHAASLDAKRSATDAAQRAMACAANGEATLKRLEEVLREAESERNKLHEAVKEAKRNAMEAHEAAGAANEAFTFLRAKNKVTAAGDAGEGKPAATAAPAAPAKAVLEVNGALLAKVASTAQKYNLSDGIIVYNDTAHVLVIQLMEQWLDKNGNEMRRALLEVYPAAVGGEGDGAVVGDISGCNCTLMPVGPQWVAHLESAAATAPRARLSVEENYLSLVANGDDGGLHESRLPTRSAESALTTWDPTTVVAQKPMKLTVFVKAVNGIKKAVVGDGVHHAVGEGVKATMKEEELVNLEAGDITVTLQRSLLELAVALIKSVNETKQVALVIQADKPVVVHCLAANDALLARIFLTPHIDEGLDEADDYKDIETEQDEDDGDDVLAAAAAAAEAAAAAAEATKKKLAAAKKKKTNTAAAAAASDTPPPLPFGPPPKRAKNKANVDVVAEAEPPVVMARFSPQF